MLEMTGINKSFHGVRVLRNAEIHVKKGEVHVLLGENGAGKSTLIKILSGAYRKEDGTILLDGEELVAKTPKEVIDKGVSVIYQEFNLNHHVPVYENIMLGKEIHHGGVIDRRRCIEESKKYLDMIGLDVDPTTLVDNLSIAQKQMVEIAKAISCNVKLLVLDEPTAAITDKETELLFKIVRELKSKGIGIIYISHRMSELFEIGDCCTIMRDGQYVTTVDLKHSNVDELTKLMVGREVSFERVENPYIRPEETVLEVQHLSYRNRVKDVSFTLQKGEILGMAGLVGAGRSEIAKCIIGAFKKDSGQVLLHGEKLPDHDIDAVIRKGVVYLSEDRKDEGLVLMHSLVDNVALPNLNLFGKFALSRQKMVETTKEYIQKLKVKTASHAISAQSLSGGNQQKIVIAKWLLTDAEVDIFDEPTRGIDVGAKYEIYNIMMDLVKNGASILMISSDLVEIQKMCNRVIVMSEGEIAGILENDESLTQDRMMACALTGGQQS